MKMFLCLLSAFFLGTSAGFSQQESSNNSPLGKAIELLHLPSTHSLNDFERVVEARFYNLPDTATGNQIMAAKKEREDSEYYRINAAKLGLPASSTRIEICKAMVAAESNQKKKQLGLPDSASPADIEKADSQLRIQNLQLEINYGKKAEGVDVAESGKIFAELQKKEAELVNPKIARGLGLPANSTPKQIQAKQQEEGRQIGIRLYGLNQNASSEDIEAARMKLQDQECTMLASRILKIENTVDQSLLKKQLKVVLEPLTPLYDAHNQEMHSSHSNNEHIDLKSLKRWAESNSQHISDNR
ncbi:MAG: hypothetical protein IT342_02185 [Candidatus Melainabacteria bacterium]|nr:hypothetical protein [Candidatus Melainabacteria bacterium]